MTDVRDVGDWRQPTISISTADGLPAAGTVTCAVEAPDGTIIPIAMTAGSPTATATPWTGVLYELTQAGQWIERFTITGDGKGKARQLVWVAADPGTAPSGTRMYATTGDYANEVHDPPPDDVDLLRALRVASRTVENMLATAIYETDSVTLLPTDAAVAAAMRTATVLQAHAAIESGDPYGLGDIDQYATVTAGGITLSRGQVGGGASASPGLWDRGAYEALQRAGLTGMSPLPVTWLAGAF